MQTMEQLVAVYVGGRSYSFRRGGAEAGSIYGGPLGQTGMLVRSLSTSSRRLSEPCESSVPRGAPPVRVQSPACLWISN